MSRHTRRGVSLVEMLVIMAVGGVIATLSIKMLQQTFATSHRAEAWLDLERGVQRLEYQLRRDLRSAETAESLDHSTLKVVIGKIDVVYAVKGDAVERTETRGDEVLRTDAFRLPGTTIKISGPEETVVTFEIVPRRETPQSKDLRIVQRVSR